MSTQQQQEVIDQLIDYIDKAILKNSVSNRHVAAVLAFLNEALKDKSIDLEELKKYFLSKTEPDGTSYLLKLLGGAEVGETIDSLTAGKGILLKNGRVQADIWYMEHWTILLDLYIIYKTIANVVVGEKNAY